MYLIGCPKRQAKIPTKALVYFLHFSHSFNLDSFFQSVFGHFTLIKACCFLAGPSKKWRKCCPKIAFWTIQRPPGASPSFVITFGLFCKPLGSSCIRTKWHFQLSFVTENNKSNSSRLFRACSPSLLGGSTFLAFFVFFYFCFILVSFIHLQVVYFA